MESELRRLRGSRPLKSVSDATNIDISTLSRLERGEQFPQRATAKSLAAFYRITEAQVYGIVSASMEDNLRSVDTPINANAQ